MSFTLIQELMLLEKISVTSRATQLRQRIVKEFGDAAIKWYKQELKKFPFYVYKDNPDATGVHHDDGVDMCYRFATEWLTKFFTKETCVEMDNYNYRFQFTDLGKKVEGSYNHERGMVNVNYEFMSKLATALYENFSDFWMDTGYEVQTSINFNRNGLLDLINKICEIWAHEVVHAHQWYRSKIHDSYRSYIQKDKKKFYEMVRNKVHEAEYLGSPQEIGSFAQELVFDLLKDIADEDTDYQIIAISDQMKYMSARGTRYEKFVDSKDKVDQKIVKRFLKKVYEEFDARRDELLEKKKKEMKKAKDDANYQAWLDSLDAELGL